MSRDETSFGERTRPRLLTEIHNQDEMATTDAGENKGMTETDRPLITAVIPTRGRAEIVTRAVRSALNQTYLNVEAIVVVDGPDPVTIEALEALKEPRLRVIALAENVGGSEARNIGARAARGTWIALLDDDDQWLPEKLATQMGMVPDPAARYCLVTCQHLKRQLGHPDVLAPRRALRPGEDVSEYMFYPEDKRHHICGPQTSSFLATRELFLAVPFSKGLKCHQDWDWYLRVMHHEGTAAVMVEQPLYIMDVEPERPRMTQMARWQLSLDWVELRRDLFTPRAYRSFLINECMFRSEETRHRLSTFRTLLSLCRRSGKLESKEFVAAVKWYYLRPSVRMNIRRWQRQIKANLWSAGRSGPAIETPQTKREVHG